MDNKTQTAPSKYHPKLLEGYAKHTQETFSQSSKDGKETIWWLPEYKPLPEREYENERDDPNAWENPDVESGCE